MTPSAPCTMGRVVGCVAGALVGGAAPALAARSIIQMHTNSSFMRNLCNAFRLAQVTPNVYEYPGASAISRAFQPDSWPIVLNSTNPSFAEIHNDRANQSHHLAS